MATLSCVQDYAERAKKILNSIVYVFYSSGAGQDFTVKLNSAAYQRYRLRPRYLRNVSNRSTDTNILGCKVEIPFGIAPTAFHQMAHPDGEIATARAANEHRTIYIVSLLTNIPIKIVAKEAPDCVLWCQFDMCRNREIIRSLIREAESVGFKAIVLTIDLPVMGNRRTTIRTNLLFPPHLDSPNLKPFVGNANFTEFIVNEFNDTVTWDDVKWLINFTKLPVILKGVLTPEDAIIAIDIGCKGIIVSNHGGRQLDTVPATIEALPDIVEAVADRIPVMIDGGITEGTDIYKALALGAKFVFVGRAILWGLAVDGQQGASNILKILKRELDLTMALTGVTKISDINRKCIVPENYYINKL